MARCWFPIDADKFITVKYKRYSKRDGETVRIFVKIIENGKVITYENKRYRFIKPFY